MFAVEYINQVLTPFGIPDIYYGVNKPAVTSLDILRSQYRVCKPTVSSLDIP